jgi:hypothetical protein
MERPRLMPRPTTFEMSFLAKTFQESLREHEPNPARGHRQPAMYNTITSGIESIAADAMISLFPA